MRYYIAAHHKPDSKEMDYKESGTEADLCLRFPEIKAVINRYNIKSLIMTFENGDRLRIYNINLAADTPSK